jgi:dipeptidyl aminopeptidase/acylaminoacyl peptidase
MEVALPDKCPVSVSGHGVYPGGTGTRGEGSPGLHKQRAEGRGCRSSRARAQSLTAAGNPSSIYVVDIAEGVPRKLRAPVDDIKLPAWSHDGNWLYFTSDVPQGHNLYRLPAEGGKSEQVTSGALAMRPAESADGAYLYFASREVHFHLEKLALSDKKREVQKEAIPAVLQWTLWHLAPGGIYYVPTGAQKSMRYFELASQRTKEMFKLDKDFDDGFSVSPDGSYLLYSQLDEENADIALMNRYR